MEIPTSTYTVLQNIIKKAQHAPIKNHKLKE